MPSEPQEPRNAPEHALSWPFLRSDRAFRFALIGLAVIAFGWIGYECWRLACVPREDGGAVDLFLRNKEATKWFLAFPVYERIHDAVYPPASYLMLWPFVGWLDFDTLRVAWLVPTLLSLVWIAWLCKLHSGANTPHERRLLWLLPLASYPVGATVGNGQLAILVVACLFSSLTMLALPRTWRRDLAIAGLMLAALVKPSVSAHFFWILLFVPGGFRAACLTLVGYIGLTFASSLAQNLNVVDLMKAWLDRAAAGIQYGATKGEGGISAGFRIKSINLHSLLSQFGLTEMISWSTYVALGLVGAWVARQRKGNLLCLLGVAAFASRFSSYHGWYDDVMLLIPMVAIVGIAKSAPDAGHRSRANLLAFLMALSLLAPGGVYALPPMLANIYVISQTAIWIAAMVFLIRRVASPTTTTYDNSSR